MFNCFSSIEALQVVHGAREKCQESRRNLSMRKSLGYDLSKSLRRKECTGIRGLHKEKLRRNNILDKCYRDPRNPLPRRR
jgi:hypothetical protein